MRAACLLVAGLVSLTAVGADPASPPANAAGPEDGGPILRVEVTPREVPLNGEIRVVITVAGDGAADALLESRPPGRLAVASRRLASQRLETGGKAFVLTYLPYATGPGEIPSFVVIVGNRQLRTDPVPVAVVSPAPLRPGASGYRPDDPASIPVRLVGSVEPERVYPGQVATIRYRLLFRTRLARLRGTVDLGPLPGAVVADLPVVGADAEVAADGETWTGRALAERRVVPTGAAGDLTTLPVRVELDVDSPPAGGRAGGTMIVERVAPPLTLEVIPLPDGQPVDFSGAVGRFRLAASLDAAAVPAGEAARLTVTVSGEGSLEGAAPPRPGDTDGVAILEPEALPTAGGRRAWAFPLVPREAGEIVLAPVTWSYLDPSDATYRTLDSGRLTLTVTSPSGGPPRTPVRARASDLRYIKPAPAALPDREKDHYRRLWYWALVILPWLAMGWGLRHRKRRAKSRPAGDRRGTERRS